MTVVLEPVSSTGHTTASDLARRLVALAVLPGASGAPTQWPGDPVLLAWLRAYINSSLYTWGFEELIARRWIGGDPYALRALPAAPPFLADLPLAALPGHLVAPLLRRISLTRPAPAAADLTLEALATDPGPVTIYRRSAAERHWGRPAFSADTGQDAPGAPVATPPLPADTVIPHLVHGIWLGRPMPPGSSFWANYGAGADRHAGRVDFVVWTDIPRLTFDLARESAPAPGEPESLRGARAMLAWAIGHGILLVNVHEVFHAGAPMVLHTPYSLELTKQLPRGYAAASDHLRVDIVHRFGGMYADGDLSFTGPQPLTDLFRRVAGSRLGMTLNLNHDDEPHPDAVVGPARHPAIALWREAARMNYHLSQAEMFEGVHWMAMPFAGRPWQENRYLVPHRSGRVHHFMLKRLQIEKYHLTPISPSVSPGREHSWIPPVTGDPVQARTAGDPLAVLQKCVSFLRWQLLAREGDLYLTAIAPIIQGLPDPDAAWTALMRTLPALLADLPPVSSVTDLHRNDDGTISQVVLPPEAEAVLDRRGEPATWIGASQPVGFSGESLWLLDERVSPLTLRAPR
jgi:hypothetical protein